MTGRVFVPFDSYFFGSCQNCPQYDIFSSFSRVSLPERNSHWIELLCGFWWDQGQIVWLSHLSLHLTLFLESSSGCWSYNIVCSHPTNGRPGDIGNRIWTCQPCCMNRGHRMIFKKTTCSGVRWDWKNTEGGISSELDSEPRWSPRCSFLTWVLNASSCPWREGKEAATNPLPMASENLHFRFPPSFPSQQSS